MTNREKLSRMALIDLLMYLDFCPISMKDCKNDCYKCRMNWLKEETKESETNDSKRN
jgi:hypothetical protein